MEVIGCHRQLPVAGKSCGKLHGRFTAARGYPLPSSWGCSTLPPNSQRFFCFAFCAFSLVPLAGCRHLDAVAHHALAPQMPSEGKRPPLVHLYCTLCDIRPGLPTAIVPTLGSERTLQPP